MGHPPSQGHYTVQIGVKGRLILPAAVRRALSLSPGDRLLLTVEPDGALKLKAARQVASELRGLFAQRSPERLLSEELIQERREAAQRE
ncbi:MAG: AbrB/MazE/SpoVT family DNA-binding domain-containing protein [Truepera sp.]|nr:AbrB/MazE/SpoVT family DNA-binding domain-containing protein [Truepera sp.]